MLVFVHYSAGIVAGSDPEQLVVTAYDPVAGRVRRKLYYTVDQFRREHLKNKKDPHLIDAVIEDARQNILA